MGLVNLGSTCYVNVVLQTLFAIRPFRQAVYAAEVPLSDDPVVKELRWVVGRGMTCCFCLVNLLHRCTHLSHAMGACLHVH